MILELGQSFSQFEWVRVTAEYSNAVLVAVLPYISDASHKLNLPVPHPITAEHVIYCNVAPQRALGVEIGIKGNWYFAFNGGYVSTIQGPKDYFTLQNPDEIPKYYGQVRTTKAEAVELSRSALKKLGITLESVFAEQEPKITETEKIGTNTVPYYRVEWLDPRSGFPRVAIDIDGEARAIARIRLLSKSLERSPPKIDVVPPALPNSQHWPLCNPEYAEKFIPIVLRALDEYGQTLSLPIPRPLTTNHIAKFSLADNWGWPHSEIELTNGWKFVYRNSDVNGYYASDNFFNNEDRPIRIKDFTGKPNMTEDEAAELVRRTIAKLNYPTNLVHMDFRPKVQKPSNPEISRLFFFWHVEAEDDLQSKIEAEVDLKTRSLKSLYFDDKALWNKPPLINVPLTLPLPSVTNGPSQTRPAQPSKSPARSFKPFVQPNGMQQ